MKKAAKSLSQLNNQIWDAIRDKFAKEVSTRDVFPDEKYAIFVLGDTTHKVSYSIDENENIVLGDDLTPVKLEREYIEIEGSFSASIVAAEEKTSQEYGYKWRVRVVDFGVDKNKTHWTKDPLVAALKKFDNAKVFMLSEAQHQKGDHPYGKPTRDIIGWLTDVAEDAQGITATLNVLRTSLGKELRTALVDSWERGNSNLLALSVDISGKAERRTVAGDSVSYLTEVKSVTVDVVYDPAAGGKFLRMAAAITQTRAKEQEMNKLEKLLAALKAQRSGEHQKLEGRITAGTVTEDEVMELLMAAPVVNKAPADSAATLKATQEALHETRILACGLTLDRELGASELPVPVQDKIRTQYANQVFEADTLKASIQAEKDCLAMLSNSGQVKDAGATKIDVGPEPLEKIKAAVDKMCGLEVADQFKDVPKMGGLHEAYVLLSGDRGITGNFQPDNISRDITLRAAFDSTTFSYILGNTLNRRMVRDYAAVEYHERKIMTVRPGVSDFKTQEAVREGYFGDIDNVDPETADYQEITSYGDEEVTYSVGQKGNLITITRKHIKNDDLGRVIKKVSRIGRAARRTFARFVWAFIIDNATYGVDSKAVFHGDHGNLGSTALAVTPLAAAAQALALMTEPDSEEVLGWPSEKFNLFIPVQLRSAAIQTVNAEKLPGGNNNDPNPVHQIADIHVVPLFTDVTDWVFTCPTVDRDIIEVAFMDGNEEPEMFVADAPAVGQMFLADKMKYKIRHEYGGVIVDYRGAYKAVVA